MNIVVNVSDEKMYRVVDVCGDESVWPLPAAPKHTKPGDRIHFVHGNVLLGSAEILRIELDTKRAYLPWNEPPVNVIWSVSSYEKAKVIQRGVPANGFAYMSPPSGI
jgi:hypothetical protein